MMSSNNFYQHWQSLLTEFERKWTDVDRHEVYQKAVSQYKDQVKYMSSNNILNYIDYLLSQTLSSFYFQKEALDDFKIYLKSQRAIIQEKNIKEIKDKQDIRLAAIDILKRDTYLDIIEEVRNLEKISFDIYIKERLMPLRDKYPTFIETLYKDVSYILDGIDEDGDNDLLVCDRTLVVENKELQLTGYQTRLHDLSTWLWMEICQKKLTGDYINVVSELDNFEKFFLQRPTYTPEYKAKLDLIKQSIRQERECNFEIRKKISFMTDKEILDYIDIAISSFDKIKDLVQGVVIRYEADDELESIRNIAADAIGVLNPILSEISTRIVYFGSSSQKVDIFQESLAVNSMVGSGIIDKAIAELKILKGQIKKHGFERNKNNGSISEKSIGMNNDSNKVFIVHGHNEVVKVNVARTLDKLGLEAIILHEQADGGKTIIEKFEDNAINAGFAVVLLTADDEGKAKRDTELKNRARQNVVFEMGYFMGKFGRNRVLLLLDKGVEKPGDLDGIVYTSIDEHDGWKLKLVKELKAAGYSVSADNI